MTASVKEDVKLRVLLLGSGGREHALAWGFGRAKSVERVFVAPGSYPSAVQYQEAER